MIEITIDGQKVEAVEREPLIGVADREGIRIPTLCYHKAITPYGSCRVCVVEAKRGSRTKVVTACNYPVEEGVEIVTNSDKIIKHRKMVVELLLARCPDVKVLRDLADELGIETPRFKLDDEKCILCGLCVRVCEEVMGIGAISFISRGIDESVDTPYNAASDVCIGCGACASVCPTGVIKVEDTEKNREIEKWHSTHELALCRLCGRPYATKAQIEYLRKKINFDEEIFSTCDTCKTEDYAKKVALLGHM